jgi:uncharacterized protein YndB with AHSA1/START domain
VYKALATASGQEKWFPNRCHFLTKAGKKRLKRELARKGDKVYMWMVYGGGVDGTERILDARKDRMLKLSFGAAGRLEFTLKKSGKGTLLELVQDEIPTTPKARVEFHMGCRTGWTFFLTNLKSVLEKGPDLRESDPRRVKNTMLVNM